MPFDWFHQAICKLTGRQRKEKEQHIKEAIVAENELQQAKQLYESSQRLVDRKSREVSRAKDSLVAANDALEFLRKSKGDDDVPPK